MSSRPPAPLPDAVVPSPPSSASAASRAMDGAAFAGALEALGYDAVVRGLDGIRSELADRDRQLCDVLQRLSELFEDLSDDRRSEASPSSDTAAHSTDEAGGDPLVSSGFDTHERMLRSVESLTLATEASVDRAGDLARSVERMAESVHELANRVDRLVRRADESDARLDRLTGLVETLADRTERSYAEPRPRLHAVPAEAGRGPEPV